LEIYSALVTYQCKVIKTFIGIIKNMPHGEGNTEYDQGNIIKLPLKVFIFQEIINALIPIFIVISPLWILVLIIHFFKSTIQSILNYVILATILLDVLIFILTFKPFFEPYTYTRMWYEPQTKWYGDLKSYFIRKWILNNVRCPKCDGKLSTSGALYKNAEDFMDYWFRCNLCKRRFKIYPMENQNLYILKEIQKKRGNS